LNDFSEVRPCLLRNGDGVPLQHGARQHAALNESANRNYGH
jgi:hypothetical protein